MEILLMKMEVSTMNKTFKMLSAALVTAVVATSSISAYAATPQLTQTNLIQPKPASKHAIYVNGKVVDQKLDVYANKQNVLMIPLRTISDQLGYKVTWNAETKSAELQKGAQWTAVVVGKDQYSVNKMYVQLGSAPESKAGVTYVPVTFFDKVLHQQVIVEEDGTIKIGEQVQGVTKKGSITNISIDEKDASLKGAIMVNGFTNGVRLNITDETSIVNQDGKKLTIADLKLGQEIEVEHGLAMTLSIPPMTNAVKIVVNDKMATPEVLGTVGEVVEAKTLTDGTVQVVIKGEKLNDQSFEMIALNLAKDTPIIGAKDNSPLKAEDLRKGTKVYGFYGPVTTKSLPAIGQAMKIVVEQESLIQPK
ncbi:copper amine oxidase N-terminal domain-containing protein [Brevibacillus laterosporus]|nr:copper amine oxidase N-terminal domain-containing protein [Brevibacillus laterosporus]